MGRKPKGDKPQTVNISFGLTQTDRDRLEMIAIKNSKPGERLNMSDLIREAVRVHIFGENATLKIKH